MAGCWSSCEGTAVELVWSNTTTRSVPLPLPDDLRRTGVKHVAFQSDNLDADLGRLADLGIRPVVGPSHSPYGLRFVFLNDPAGNRVEIMGN
ncbi:VOC family protein [Sinorhizobium fredii]|nr:VOC family protein [Sinorhizobium fredii]AAQ87355.1 Hypothetical protein RNGR00228 [Sinorhizobium fredii NGR234]